MLGSVFATFAFVIAAAAAVQAAALPKVAVLAPDGAETSRKFAEELSEKVGGLGSVVDADLSASAFRSNLPSDPFNMTIAESKRAGAVIGCDFLLMTRAVIQRRTASDKGEYYEAYAAVYLISSRTGRLVRWELSTFEDKAAAEAEKKLLDSADGIATRIGRHMNKVTADELHESPVAALEEPPDPESPLAKNFKAPIPFKRIKPEYTAQAAFYEIAATVEILVDLDAQGAILRTEIARWAGFGLDEAVEKAVREMNWRPAERGGKFLPMRFLVRYNFKKIDKDQ